MRVLGLPFVALTAASVALFAFVPEVDLAVASLFYHDGFPLADHPVSVFLHGYAGYPGIALGLAGLVLWLAALAVRRRHLWGVQRGVALFLGLSLLLGPGLAVNGVLKDHWGRARPAQIQEFGGERTFSPALVIADQCERNCAFTSGHAAIAFYLMVPAMVLAPPWRAAVLAGGLLYGIVVGAVRMAQGGHFLSDVVFSLIVVWTVAGLLYLVLFGRARDDR